MSESTEHVEGAAIAKAPVQFIVIAGFVGGSIVDEETGRRAVHDRGDVVTVGEDISESTAAVELQRNRIVAYSAEVAASVKASVAEVAS
jgi:hypothetical protein